MPPIPPPRYPLPASRPRPEPGTPKAGGQPGEGFHTDTERLIGAAAEIDKVVADTGKYRKPKPPKASEVGDERAAGAISAYLTLHNESARWVHDELAALASALRTTARDYAATEQHVKDGMPAKPDPHTPLAPRPAPAPRPGPAGPPTPGQPGAPGSSPEPGNTPHPGPGDAGRGDAGNTEGSGPGGSGSGQGGTNPPTPPPTAPPEWRPRPRNPHQGNVRMVSHEEPRA